MDPNSKFNRPSASNGQSSANTDEELGLGLGKLTSDEKRSHTDDINNEAIHEDYEYDLETEKNAIQPSSTLVKISTAIKQVASRQFVSNPAPPPDGGFSAWSCCIMAHFLGFSTWGLSNAFGVLQTYYVTSLDRPPSDISWIGSVNQFLLFFVSTFSGRLTDAGYFHQTFFAGTVLLLIGVFTASASTTYWQLFLSQGVCMGIGGGLAFCPSLSVTGTYFKKHRALALSICAAGSNTGGLVFAAVYQQLLPRIGYAWTMRVVGFMILACVVPANFIIKPRELVRTPGPMIDWASFKELPYTFFAIGMFIIFIGTFFPVYFLGSFGKNIIGIDSVDANSLILIVNGAGLAGRIIPTILANNYTGPLNLLIPLTASSAIILFSWTQVKSRTGLIVFDIFFGMVQAGGQGLFPPTLGSLTTDVSKMGIRVGMIFTIVSIACLIGPPIAGVLIQKDGGEYLYAQIYGGLVLLVGVCFLIAARISKTGWTFMARV